MRLQKVIYIFDYAKLVWTEVDRGDLVPDKAWLFEGHCFNKHVREFTTLPPSDQNATHMLERHFGRFGKKNPL